MKRPWPVLHGGEVPDDIHVPFIRAALIFGLLGGFTLAVALPIEAALGRMDLSWVSHAQVHGHLQVLGFAGLFVVGVAFKLAPRFGAGALHYPRLVPVIWILLVLGLLLRSLGQPLADQPIFAVLMVMGVSLEVTGAACFLVVVVATLRPALRAFAPHALLMGGAAGWLLVQSILGGWWLNELAGDGGTVLASPRNTVLLHLQVYGFLLGTFIGVGMRAFPTFFGMPQPSQRLGVAAAGCLHLGLLAIVIAGLANEVDRDATTLASAGQALVGVAVILAVSAFGWWRRETRLAAASQPIAWSLRATLLWLTVAGVLLAGSGAMAALEGDAVRTTTADAIRHVVAVGVITLGITAMAQLILPEFASERITRRTAHWRGSGFALALSAAVVLRSILPLAGLEGEARFWAMGVGGLLAIGAVAVFAWLIVRAWRAHTAYMQRIAAHRAQALPMADR